MLVQFKKHIKFLRSVAGCTSSDKIKNQDIWKERNIYSVNGQMYGQKKSG
jgi:hypothetical protein